MTHFRSTLATLAAVSTALGFFATPARAQPLPAVPPASTTPASAAVPAPAPQPAPIPTPDPGAAPPPPADAAPPTHNSPPPGGLAAPQPLAPGSSNRLAGGTYDGPPLLFGPGKLKLGAYGSLGVAYTHMLHRDGVVTDVAAAVLIDHRVTIGLAGYAFSRTPSGPAAFDGVPREFSTVYGGLLLRYATFTDFPVYASVGMLVGGGALVLADKREYYRRGYDDDPTSDDYASRRERADGYFVVQPDISLHVNATRWLRFGATGGYRFATAAHRFGYDGTAMSGATVGGNVKFGWF